VQNNNSFLQGILNFLDKIGHERFKNNEVFINLKILIAKLDSRIISFDSMLEELEKKTPEFEIILLKLLKPIYEFEIDNKSILQVIADEYQIKGISLPGQPSEVYLNSLSSMLQSVNESISEIFNRQSLITQHFKDTTETNRDNNQTSRLTELFNYYRPWPEQYTNKENDSLSDYTIKSAP